MPPRAPALSPASSPAQTGQALLIPALDRALELLDRPHRLSHSAKQIHKLRIATRRAQAAVLLLEPCLTDKTSQRLLKQLRKLRRAAGDVRDADLIARTLKAQLARRRTPADKHARHLLRDLKARHRDARADLHAGIKHRRGKLDKACGAARRELDRRAPPPDLASLAARLLRTQQSDIRRLARADLSDPARLHRLRRRLKLRRYTMEMLEPVLPRASGPGVEQLKKLQDALGRWTDLHAALSELDRRAPGRPKRSALDTRSAHNSRSAQGAHGSRDTPNARGTPNYRDPHDHHDPHDPHDPRATALAKARASVHRRERAAHRLAIRAVATWQTRAATP